jgi:transposase
MGGLKRKADDQLMTGLSKVFARTRRLGYSVRERLAAIRDMGYKRSQATVYRQIKRVVATGHALVVDRRNGRKPLLDAQDKKKIKDFVLEKNVQNCPFSLASVRAFISEELGKSVSATTMKRVMLELNMTQRTCRRKTPGFRRSAAELRKIYWDFILKLRAEKTFFEAPENILLIDATYSGRPGVPDKTWAPKGSGPLMSNVATFPHTSVIITCPSGDGKLTNPCELWTSNIACRPFDGDTLRLKVRALKYDDLLAKCRYFHINLKRVHFIEDGSLYTSESPEIYMQYLEKVDRNAVVFHDGSRAFKPKGVSIFETMGFKKHVEYPSDVHQYLSPNDFHLHGCKAAWHREYPNFKDELSAMLRLMELIDINQVNNSREYFQNNIFNVVQSDLLYVIGR